MQERRLGSGRFDQMRVMESAWIWIFVFCGTCMTAIAQDAGEIVNTLNAHSSDCGTHDWQVVDVGSDCGPAPCSYPNAWCANEGGSLSCLFLPDSCQNILRTELTTSTSTQVPTTTQFSETLPSLNPLNPISIGPTLPPFVTESGLRPLPIGHDGMPLVLFKVVGGLRPTCPDNSNFCCFWARNGQCNDNAFFMQTYCRRSCQELRHGGPDAVGRDPKPGELISIGIIGENAFGDPPGGTCQDLHPKCALWANRGECKRNSLFMVSICRPSCGKCPPCLPQCQTFCPQISNDGSGCQQRCSGCAGRK